MDIANETTKAREIIFWRLHPLVGQETSIEGFYHGPLWLYFISIGIFIFNFHPFGSLFMLILLSVATTAFLMRYIAKKVSPTIALVVGASLQVFWPYYDISRFAFSPFPLAFLAILQVILLSEASEGNLTAFFLAAAVSSLPSHFEVASLPPFVALFLAFSVFSLIEKRLSLKHFAYGIGLIILTHSARIVSEISTGFQQLHAIQEHAGTSQTSYLANSQFDKFVQKIVDIASQGLIPQSALISMIILAVILAFILKHKKLNKFVKNFYIFSLLATLLAYLWFGSNTGWHPWHTVYLPPLIFISAVLVITSLGKKLAIPLFVLLLLLQLPTFVRNYAYNFRPSADARLLVNELAAVDWTYQESANNGFYVYTYLPSVYDYPYQYLYWWRGTKKYKYVPCEYSTFPQIPDFFIRNYQKYQEPQKPCENIRYLIIEPDKNGQNQETWLAQVRKNTSLEKAVYFGTIRVEKRRIN